MTAFEKWYIKRVGTYKVQTNSFIKEQDLFYKWYNRLNNSGIYITERQALRRWFNVSNANRK